MLPTYITGINQAERATHKTRCFLYKCSMNFTTHLKPFIGLQRILFILDLCCKSVENGFYKRQTVGELNEKI